MFSKKKKNNFSFYCSNHFDSFVFSLSRGERWRSREESFSNERDYLYRLWLLSRYVRWNCAEEDSDDSECIDQCTYSRDPSMVIERTFAIVRFLFVCLCVCIYIYMYVCVILYRRLLDQFSMKQVFNVRLPNVLARVNKFFFKDSLKRIIDPSS